MLRLSTIPTGILRNSLLSMNFRRNFEGCKLMVWQCQCIISKSRYFNGSFGHLAYNKSCILPSSSLQKFQSTRAASADPRPGVLTRALRKLGFLDFSRSRLMRSGYYLYETVADQINYGKFFKEFQLEDTFYSWFLITELHVWMLLVRVMAEGEEGRLVRNRIVGAMWEDVDTRAKKLGASNPSNVKMQLRELADQFQAAIIGYDEGLLTDDKVLAGAIWRRFFQQKCDNPEDVECLVRYIRRQVKMLDELPRDRILLADNITWLELEPIVSR